ncbi:hypothetical protein VPH35_003961 [Triticum aestivum]|uniref:protein FAR1-RELATED SEQUENCE 8 isoform X2 n=1 Tax=Triticum aestivum TaxID=4565 RepID=UPI001D019125|nr:protein FAR1-RELATED SEQUENCE 8-like isoform X2 [Triticum aestivum]
MAYVVATGPGLEFLSDPVDRFPVPPLGGADLPPNSVDVPDLLEQAGGSSIGGVGEHLPMVQLDFNGVCPSMSVSAIESQKSTGEPDPEAPGWTKRVRVGRAPTERPPCPGRVCALEKTIRGYAEKKTDIVVVPEVGDSFDSLGEAYDFYNLYSWEIGFSIRYGKSRLNVERTKCMQEIVCGCSGKPKKSNTRSCRCECPAMIRLLRSNDNGWYISEHRPSHNHSLVD